MTDDEKQDAVLAEIESPQGETWMRGKAGVAPKPHPLQRIDLQRMSAEGGRLLKANAVASSPADEPAASAEKTPDDAPWVPAEKWDAAARSPEDEAREGYNAIRDGVLELREQAQRRVEAARAALELRREQFEDAQRVFDIAASAHGVLDAAAMKLPVALQVDL